MGLAGHRRWPKNPKYCAGCFRLLSENRGGAEIECTLFFADIRGSTTLAERMRPGEFSRLMGRFYRAAFEILVEHDAFVDKFVGDEVVAIFVPALAGDAHGARAIDAARALLRATGHGGKSEPWVPVGVGIGTGTAYVGSIADGADTELTALGDVVNTTARLSSAAGPGEILVMSATARAAGLPGTLEHRSLLLRGKAERTDVVVLTMTSPTA